MYNYICIIGNICESEEIVNRMNRFSVELVIFHNKYKNKSIKAVIMRYFKNRGALRTLSNIFYKAVGSFFYGEGGE